MKLKMLLALITLSLPFAMHANAMPNMKPPVAESEQSQAQPIAGKVLELINSGGYTYLLLQDAEGFKDWVAVPELYVQIGEEVELLPGTQMGEFKSKPLNRTFERIIFSAGPTTKFNEKRKVEAHKKADMSKAAPGRKQVESRIVEGLKVEKAKGENAYSIDELFAKRDALQNKTVIVRGQVVKVSVGIMGRNWVHIKDGSGENGVNKLVVTTQDEPNLGEVVTVIGVFHNDVDFGGGYQYAVIIENATVK